MLILTRALAQSLTIGDDIKLTVIEVKGNRVRLGLNVPPDIRVQRIQTIRRASPAVPKPGRLRRT